MSLGIYKQGQGYWVRVLTAAFIAVIALGGAGWAAGQAAKFEANLKRTTFAVGLEATGGTVTPGERVTLVGKPELPGVPPRELGSARVASFDATNLELRIDGVQIDAKDADATMTGSIRSTGLAVPVKSVVGVPPIEPRLLIGLVVGVVLLLGAALAYYVTGVRQGTVDFLIATDMEMKKVNWSSWKEVKGSTAVVIMACVLIAGFLYSADLAISWFFRAIGVLVQAS